MSLLSRCKRALGVGSDPADGESSEESLDPTRWIDLGSWRLYVTFAAMVPITVLNPLLSTQDVLQSTSGWFAKRRYDGALPDAASYDQRADYRLPVDGTWTVLNGSPVQEHSHSWSLVNQRYAYDLVITDEDGRTRPAGTAATVENYYCYDEPVLAPADGVVVDAYDGAPESARAGGFCHPIKGDIRGCFVVLQHAPDEFCSLVHLRPGSVRVEPGDEVAAGDEVGRCGHTGNSSEPHLHVQVQDNPTFELAASLPVQFSDVDLAWPGEENAWPDALETNGLEGRTTREGRRERSFLTAGHRVEFVGSSGEGGTQETEGSQETGGEQEVRTEQAVRGEQAPESEQEVGREHPDETSDPNRSRPSCRGASVARLGVGLASGGFVAVAAGLLGRFASVQVPGTVLAGALAGVALLVGGYRLGTTTRTGRRSSTPRGWAGVGAGWCLVAVATAVLDPGRSAGTIDYWLLGLVAFALGFVLFVAGSRYDARSLPSDGRPRTAHA